MSIASVLDSDLLMRIRMEYVEMPGLQLTDGQARRFWNLDPIACGHILTALVDEKFLTRTPNGTYLRCGGGRYRPSGSSGAGRGAAS
ncbi:MAG: hypothetical protein ABI868_01975 [Acidobacteriota bacterium]